MKVLILVGSDRKDGDTAFSLLRRGGRMVSYGEPAGRRELYTDTRSVRSHSGTSPIGNMAQDLLYTTEQLLPADSSQAPSRFRVGFEFMNRKRQFHRVLRQRSP